MNNSPTVFVLDDDPAIQDSLAQVLRVLGLRAEFFTTVADFCAAHDPSRTGCLLLDLRLPGDGFSLLKKLKSDGSSLPVIVITGHGDADTKERVMELGAIAFYEKPFRIRELSDTIREAFERSTRLAT